jgi:hypothetical protein
MITEIEIQNFLYEIDEPVGDDNAVLSDDQINSLAQKIYNNQKILFSLFDKVSDKPCVCGFWGDKISK